MMVKQKKEKEQKNSLFASIIKAFKKRFSIFHLLFLAVIIAANTFAWFIYMDKISSDIDVRVKAWNVSFRFNNQNMEDYINFNVSDIYPGMSPFQQTLAVTNDGEMDANLTYEIVSISVMGDTYTTENGDMTEAQLISHINQAYPFRITISTNHSLIANNGGTAMFYINVTWPFESYSNGVSNDSLDNAIHIIIDFLTE